MDQMYWPVTSLYPSTETYQEDISYKFYFVYFIDTDNQIIMFPNHQDIGRKNRPHLLTTQRTIIIQISIYNKLKIERKIMIKYHLKLNSFHRNLTLIKSHFDPINANIICTNIL